MTKVDPVKITSDLIKCQSVTPKDDGAIKLIEKLLSNAGFRCQIIERNGIINLFARWGLITDGSTFCFNGHTDVVPTGNADSWTYNPFSATEKEGFLYGRGATDMKSALGAFISAALNYISKNKPKGSIVIAITGDEEGEAEDGSVAILDWMTKNNERIDHCLVGEPTSSKYLGDTIKVGRRGSLTAKLTAVGLQGHVAYPEKAINPIPSLIKLLAELEKKNLDGGSEFFDPSSLVITSIDTGNVSSNVIPQKAEASLNIRFNDIHSGDSLIKWLKETVQKVTNQTKVKIKLDTKVSARPFICKPGPFVDIVSQVIEAKTRITPIMSTSGGTSDARFIQEYCPVVEFGLVGKTMHQANENVEISQILNLSEIYEKILYSYFNWFEKK